MPRRYLSEKDHAGLQRLAKSFKAGKGIFSKRPVPTRRRRTAGGGGGNGSVWATADEVIAAGMTGSVTIYRGSASTTTWTNESGKNIPIGYIVIGEEFGGQVYIKSAFCPVPE